MKVKALQGMKIRLVATAMLVIAVAVFFLGSRDAATCALPVAAILLTCGIIDVWRQIKGVV